MSVLAVDLHQAIVTVWEASTLNTQFKAYWPAANQSEFAVLNDQEASPAQPFPYCVFNQDQGSTTGRMTGAATAGRIEIHEIPWEFHVHAKAHTSAKSAKKIAAE